MPQVNSYDARNVSVTVDSVFITGFADGTFVDTSKDEDNIDTAVGAQGDVAVTEVNNQVGTITLTLQQSSPSVAYLNRLANSRKMVPVYVISNQSGAKEIIGGTQARVIKPADVSFSDSQESRAFEIRVFDYTSN